MQTTTESSNASHAEEKEHPRGLYVLFGAEGWERFSYYGMRALLVLYMTRQLHFDRPHALAIYATYTGLVYLTPLAGGALADAILGRRKAVLIGGILMGYSMYRGIADKTPRQRFELREMIREGPKSSKMNLPPGSK